MMSHPSDIVEMSDFIGDKGYLHNAVRKGSIEWLEFCLNNGESVFRKDKEGNTPLRLAAKYRYGLRYEIFLKLVIHAQKEIREKFKKPDTHQYHEDCRMGLSVHLLSELEHYTQLLMDRNKVIEFFSFIFLMDKTGQRNIEQTDIYEGIWKAEETKNYISLLGILKSCIKESTSRLHKKLIDSFESGRKIVYDREKFNQYRLDALEETKRKNNEENNKNIKKLSNLLPESFIKKFKDLKDQNKLLDAENKTLKTEVDELKKENNDLKAKVDDLELKINEQDKSISGERRQRKTEMRELKKLILSRTPEYDQPKVINEEKSSPWMGLFGTNETSKSAPVGKQKSTKGM